MYIYNGTGSDAGFIDIITLARRQNRIKCISNQPRYGEAFALGKILYVLDIHFFVYFSARCDVKSYSERDKDELSINRADVHKDR